MIRTYAMTVNDIGNREAIIVTGAPKRVVLIESPSVVGWPTTDYEVADVASGGTAYRKLAGTPFTDFERQGGYYPGETIGYIATVGVGGSTTFLRVEIY